MDDMMAERSNKSQDDSQNRNDENLEAEQPPRPDPYSLEAHMLCIGALPRRSVIFQEPIGHPVEEK